MQEKKGKKIIERITVEKYNFQEKQIIEISRDGIYFLRLFNICPSWLSGRIVDLKKFPMAIELVGVDLNGLIPLGKKKLVGDFAASLSIYL